MFMVLRILRLFKLVRAARLLVQFKPLWMLVRGFLASASTMFYVLVLFILIMYIFACAAIEFITKSEFLRTSESLGPLVQEHWPSIPVTMFTLLQLMLADNIGQL